LMHVSSSARVTSGAGATEAVWYHVKRGLGVVASCSDAAMPGCIVMKGYICKGGANGPRLIDMRLEQVVQSATATVSITGLFTCACSTAGDGVRDEQLCMQHSKG